MTEQNGYVVTVTETVETKFLVTGNAIGPGTALEEYHKGNCRKLDEQRKPVRISCEWGK